MWFILVCIECAAFRKADVVSALNARFRAGTPSDDPASAGVVLHALNEQLGVEPSPWLSRTSSLSCVIANARLPFIYHGALHDASFQTPGFVMRPSVVKRALLCAYPGDAGTNRKRCTPNWRETASPNKCTPGCPSETNPGHGSVVLNLSQAMFLHEERVARLSASTPSDEKASPAASLERARLAMQQQHRQYSELVLAADTCNSLLPGTIEAVYMLPHTTITNAIVAEANLWRERRNETVWPPARSAENERKGRAIHAQLLRHFNLTAKQLPLLELNISDRAAPFRLAPRLTGAEYAALKSSLPPPPSAEAQDGLFSAVAAGVGKLNADGNHEPASAGVVLHGTKRSAHPPPVVLHATNSSNRHLRQIYWIHFPKTSSLFATTALSYACGAERVPLERVPKLTGRGPGAQESDCGGLLSSTQCCGTKHSPWFHDPLPWPAGGGFPTGQGVVFMVRDPIQRALSAFAYLHQKEGKCCGPGWGWDKGNRSSSRKARTAAVAGNLSAYLAEPGAAGCQTKMLVGRGCMASEPPSAHEEARAVAFAKTHAAFVGLADAGRYRSSVCLWHARFGGKPVPSEVLATQLATQGRPHNVAAAGKFVDRSDQALYAAVVHRFEAEVKTHASEVSLCEANLTPTSNLPAAAVDHHAK